MSIFNAAFVANRAFPIACCGALFAITCAPAMAAEDNIVPTAVAVHFSDLDLATNQGVTRLNHRIQYAAHQACISLLDTPSGLAGRVAYNQCHQVALVQARQQVAAIVKSQHLAHR